MGFIGDLHKLNKQAKEMRKDYDPSTQMSDAMDRMRAVNESMEDANKALADGVPGTAQIVTVGPTTGTVNTNPMMHIDLLVTPQDGVPRPMSKDLVVPMQHLGRVAVGATLPVLVSPTDPDAVAIMWEQQ